MRAGWMRIATTLALSVMLIATATKADARRTAAIVIDAADGSILHEDNPDRRIFPASLTKMMTLYMVFDAIERGGLSMNTPIRASKRAAAQPPSKIGLEVGQRITLEDAVKALITKSANDVATAIAEHMAGSESRFAAAMTKRARRMGLTRTTFRNASGLPDERQLTTVRDMARLSLALLRDHPHHYHYLSMTHWRFRGVNYRNHNRMLRSYAGVDGLKTGYIRASGFNLAASAVRGGRRLVAVVVGGETAKSRDAQMARLLDRAFLTPSRNARDVLVARAITPEPPRPNPRRSVAVAAAAPAAIAPPKPRPARTTPPPVARLAAGAPPAPASAAPKPTRATEAARPVARPATRTAAAPDPIRRTPWSGARSRRGPIVISAATVSAAARVEADSASRVMRKPNWGVQVGAFRRYSAAHLAVTRAAQRAPHLLNAGVIAITPVHQGGATMFRARLIGLDRRAANDACRLLQRERAPCLPIRLARKGERRAAA